VSCGVVTAGGLAFGLALLLCGCGSSDGPNTSGPFGHAGTDRWVQCFPVPRGGVGTFAGLEFSNRGGPARIERVTLADAHNLQIVSAWAVPITGLDLMGMFAGYPPVGYKGSFPGHLAPGVQWDQRQRVVAAVIPHSQGQDVVNLVLVLKPSGVVGTAKDVDVNYVSGGTHYLRDFGVTVQVYNGNQKGCL